MYINYDYYHAFYHVAKCGNVTRAAKLLLCNQPNLTRTIKTLESELGCPLFFRSSQGMRLTPEGEKLYAHISAAVGHIEAGESEIISAKNLDTGSVSVAASETALRCHLLPVLRKYRALYPKIRLRIGNHSTPQAIEALKNGFADIAVVTTPTMDVASLIEKKVRRLNEVAVCGAGFPELAGRRVPLGEIASLPLISLGAETKTYELYSEFFEEKGFRFAPEIEAATADQILPMVEADLGIGFVPREFLAGATGVNVIDLEDALPTRDICLLKRRDQTLSVAAKELERLILENEE